jgi:hypothetical protein
MRRRGARARGFRPLLWPGRAVTVAGRTPACAPQWRSDMTCVSAAFNGRSGSPDCASGREEFQPGRIRGTWNARTT